MSVSVAMNKFIKQQFEETSSKKIMKSFAIKAAIAGSAIYYVREQGIWKNSDEAIESSKRIKSVISPYIQEVKAQIPIELPEVPETENMCQLAKEYWNLGVRASFSFLIQLPEYLRTYAKKGADAILENAEIKNFVSSFSGSESLKAEAK